LVLGMVLQLIAIAALSSNRVFGLAYDASQ
jgi:hypothetical protein